MKAKIRSRLERGKLWVACCECKRGGNGDGSDNCSSGWKSKKWDMMGCFVGKMIDKSKTEELIKARK